MSNLAAETVENKHTDLLREKTNTWWYWFANFEAQKTFGLLVHFLKTMSCSSLEKNVTSSLIQ